MVLLAADGRAGVQITVRDAVARRGGCDMERSAL